MFENLSLKFQDAFRKLSGKKNLSDNNMSEALTDIRTALLDADVNYQIANKFISEVKDACVGQEVLRSVTPGEQTIKIVNDKLIELMGSETAQLNLSTSPTVIMLCGLHGSGKTTTCAKLALFLQKKHKKRVMLAACDLYRPAAIEQLEILGRELSLPVFSDHNSKDVVAVATMALAEAKRLNRDVLIVDTAGRLQIDQPLVKELVQVKTNIKPQEILLVADSALGQEAVSVAMHFDQALTITGIILTKLDGDARGGAALSMRQATGKPIKFITVGERPNDLETFHPDRMASRILGMGDIVSLVERAADAYKEEEAAALEEKIRKSTFGFDDFLNQMNTMRKMGGLASLMKFLPGMGNIPSEMLDDSQFKRFEGIIHSMTHAERRVPEIISTPRRTRIAKGSGSELKEVNEAIKRFLEARKMMAQIANDKNGGMLGKLFGGGMPDLSGGMPQLGAGGMPNIGMGLPGTGHSNLDNRPSAQSSAAEKARKDARRKMAKATKKKNHKKK